MVYVVDTADDRGIPWCPICHTRVKRLGEFDTPGCWVHFHKVVHEEGSPIEMNYLALEEQPWYTSNDDHGQVGVVY